MNHGECNGVGKVEVPCGEEPLQIEKNRDDSEEYKTRLVSNG